METRIRQFLEKLGGLSNARTRFLVHVLVLFVSLRGRVNFLNMARYGIYSEKTYRRHFEEPLEWFMLNRHLIHEYGSGRYVIAADASFYPKSGTHTPHLGNFWNGCAGKAMPGLEGHTFAVIDRDLYTAFHLHTQQTPGELPDDKTRPQQYVQHIIDHSTELRQFSPYVVYDRAAANQPFIDRLCEKTDVNLVSKMRCDADVRYLYTGPHPKRQCQKLKEILQTEVCTPA
ncbi:MAG: transposase [bacterium]|nr:transposase [bacterium]